MPGFHCRTCGEYHDSLPLAFGPDAPDAWAAIAPGDRAPESVLTSEQCILGNDQFFVRGCLDIPIHGREEVFRWLVWVSVAEAGFWRMDEMWEEAGRESEPPCVGWLNATLPGYPATLDLRVSVHTRPVGERPIVEVETKDHPLAFEQREGISWETACVRTEALLHGASL
jgi:hypothetical protein